MIYLTMFCAVIACLLCALGFILKRENMFIVGLILLVVVGIMCNTIKNNQDEILVINVDKTHTIGDNQLFLTKEDKEIIIEKEIPALFIIRCKEELVIHKNHYGQYILKLEDNL